MTKTLPPSASVASQIEGAKMNAPAAARNADVLCNLLTRHAPRQGQALEIASGTGQHIVAFAQKMPGVIWQPSEIDPARIDSINAYANEVDLSNLKVAKKLDATNPGWSAEHQPLDLVVLINLLHLISCEEAKILITEAVSALGSNGSFILYGPFMRDGVLTSPGDAQFHGQLTEADNRIGYKNDADIEAWLSGAGAKSVIRTEMPANNLAFVAFL